MKVVGAAAVFLLATVLLSVLACGGGSSQPTPGPTRTPVATATVEPTVTVTPTLTPTPTSTPSYNVYILEIDYKGNFMLAEADEYVAIINMGDTSVNMRDWILRDITDGAPYFRFPDYVLGDHSLIRVYTREYHPEWGGFRFNVDEGIWNNSHPDVAALYDADGNLVSQASYEIE